MLPNSSYKQSGFTLVELAIVLMIVGLLIGGVLRGQELMKNAQVAATIRQVSAYTGAIHMFQDAYSAMPGDMRNAMIRLPNCSTAMHCANGDGDGHVGTGVVAWADTNIYSTMPETMQFWKHMALAHLISGVVPSSDYVTPAWGETNPSAKIAGGFEFYWDQASANHRSEHIFRLSNGGIINGSTMNGQGKGAISPVQAAQMDRKMDDGLPSTGGVYADYGVATDFCKVNSGPGGSVIYDETTSQLNCTIFFTL